MGSFRLEHQPEVLKSRQHTNNIVFHRRYLDFQQNIFETNDRRIEVFDYFLIDTFAASAPYKSITWAIASTVHLIDLIALGSLRLQPRNSISFLSHQLLLLLFFFLFALLVAPFPVEIVVIHFKAKDKFNFGCKQTKFDEIFILVYSHFGIIVGIRLVPNHLTENEISQISLFAIIKFWIFPQAIEGLAQVWRGMVWSMRKIENSSAGGWWWLTTVRPHSRSPENCVHHKARISTKKASKAPEILPKPNQLGKTEL